MTDERAPEHEPSSTSGPAATPPPPLAPLVHETAAPETPPPAAPQPTVAWAAPPAPAIAARQPRTFLAAIAGILLLLGGIGGVVLGLLVVVLGSAAINNLGQFGDFPELGADPARVLGGFVAFVGIIVIVYSAAYLLAGIGVLRSRTYGRVLGIIVGIISGLIWLSAVTNANQIPDATGAARSAVFAIVALGLHLYIVVVLLFAFRSRAAASG